MSTYLINQLRIPGDVLNEQGVLFFSQVETTAEAYGGKWLAMGDVEVLEGSWPGAAVLMEFPDREAAYNWYNSPEYQAILPLRTRNSISDMILIDSLSPGVTVAGFAAQVRAAIAAAS